MSFETLAAIFNPPPVSVPTTDEMDSTTPEERYKLVALCEQCLQPHFFTGSPARMLQLSGEVCECGSQQFYDLRSERTFDPTARRKPPKRRNR